ncbi:MAG TPA: hypothetical protein VNM14_20595 [Planctomycetota bacterium]|nr:hypothetical protein [Planctomycetota bacterium]
MMLVCALLLLVDQPPSLIVREPVADRFVTPTCKHPIDVEAWAPAGITRLTIEYQVVSQNFTEALKMGHDFEKDELTRDGGSHLRGRWTLDLSEFGLVPGDHVRLRFRAESRAANVQSKDVLLSIVAPQTLQKDLGTSLDRVRDELSAALTRQDLARESTRWLSEDLAQGKTPSEARFQRAALDQAELGADLRAAARKLRQLHERAVANDVFPAPWRQSIAGVVEDLEARVPIAAALSLDTPEKLRDARKFQDDCRAGIAKALEGLPR